MSDAHSWLTVFHRVRSALSEYEDLPLNRMTIAAMEMAMTTILHEEHGRFAEGWRLRAFALGPEDVAICGVAPDGAVHALQDLALHGPGSRSLVPEDLLALARSLEPN